MSATDDSSTRSEITKVMNARKTSKLFETDVTETKHTKTLISCAFGNSLDF